MDEEKFRERVVFISCFLFFFSHLLLDEYFFEDGEVLSDANVLSFELTQLLLV